MKVEIIRVEQGDDGTFGVLKLEGKCFCVTLELPWVDNQNNISCIPDSDYICYRFDSPSHGEVWELQDVPNRTHVQIHPGNSVKDTLGCIVVAQYFGKLQGNRAVLNSGNTFKQFMLATKQANRLDLTIDSYRDLSRFVGSAF
jgi:hypothetical protein